MYEDAVALALTFDGDLAANIARQASDDEALSRKLWLAIARHLIGQGAAEGGPPEVSHWQSLHSTRQSHGRCRPVLLLVLVAPLPFLACDGLLSCLLVHLASLSSSCCPRCTLTSPRHSRFLMSCLKIADLAASPLRLLAA